MWHQPWHEGQISSTDIRFTIVFKLLREKKFVCCRSRWRLMPRTSAAKLLFCLLLLVHKSLPSAWTLIIYFAVVITAWEHPASSLCWRRLLWERKASTRWWTFNRHHWELCLGTDVSAPHQYNHGVEYIREALRRIGQIEKSTGVRIVGQNYFQCKCAEANVVSARSLPCCVPGFSFRLITWQHGIDFLSLGQLTNLTRLKMNLFDSVCKIRADLIK